MKEKLPIRVNLLILVIAIAFTAFCYYFVRIIAERTCGGCP